MVRLIIASLVLCLLAASSAYSAPAAVAVAKKPGLVCPKTEVGDADLQARYMSMWERYSKDIDEAHGKLQAAVEAQLQAATNAGILSLRLFWKDISKVHEQTGELRWDESSLKKVWSNRYEGAAFPDDFSIDVKKASEAYSSATEALKKGYADLVSALTKQEQDDNAIKIRDEINELLAEKAGDAEPSPKKVAKPAPKPLQVVSAPKDGKYSVVFNDGWGLLLEKKGDILWVLGDISPKRPNGDPWGKPRAVQYEVSGTKLLTDDGTRESGKTRFALTWDFTSGEVTYLYDDFKGKKLTRIGKMRGGQ